jgi:hypothetical protein
MRKSLIAFVLVSLATVQVCLPDDELYSGAAGKGPTGPVRSGFALSLASDAPVFFLGTPIWVTLEVRNESGRDQGGMIGSRHSAYVFLIKNRLSGGVVPRNPDSDFGGGFGSRKTGGWPIPEGTSMYARFRLDLLYELKWPGVYTVQVSKGAPRINDKRLYLQSNTITITVLP